MATKKVLKSANMLKRNLLSREVPFYYQKEYGYDCGPVAIRMVIDSLREGLGEEKLNRYEYRELLEITMNGDIYREEGTHKEQMIEGIEYFDFKVNQIEPEFKNLLKCVDNDHPAIVLYQWLFDDGKTHYHYSVLAGHDEDKKELYFNDPYPYSHIKRYGHHIIKSSEFKKAWDRPRSKKWGIEITGKNE